MMTEPPKNHEQYEFWCGWDRCRCAWAGLWDISSPFFLFPAGPELNADVYLKKFERRTMRLATKGGYWLGTVTRILARNASKCNRGPFLCLHVCFLNYLHTTAVVRLYQIYTEPRSSCLPVPPPVSEPHRLSAIYHQCTHRTLHRIASHHITSRHITSHPIASHHITEHHITSHHRTSHRITHHTTSHHITEHRIAPPHIIHSAPHRTALRRAGTSC